MNRKKKAIVLSHLRAPGDVVCFTAAIRDLALQYLEEYEIHISGSCLAIWENNPYIADIWRKRPPSHLRKYCIDYQKTFRRVREVRHHFLTGFHADLEKKLDLSLPVRKPRGDLHLSEQELRNRPVEPPYWLLIAGGKTDMPIKVWSQSRFQQLVDALSEHGIRCVQRAAVGEKYWHYPLRGVIDETGPNHLRHFMQLVYHAEGVICPVTAAMHIAAAFEKPCVVIAGGREAWWWEAYVNRSPSLFGPACERVSVEHRYLSPFSYSETCPECGCWRTHTVSSEEPMDRRRCNLTNREPNGKDLPRCLDEISVERVLEAVLAYNSGEKENQHV